MRLWVTKITAIDPMSGELCEYIGPNVPGINWDDAEDYCQQNGLGYCAICGELIAEIPINDTTGEIYYHDAIDYSIINMN